MRKIKMTHVAHICRSGLVHSSALKQWMLFLAGKPPLEVCFLNGSLSQTKWPKYLFSVF